MDIPSAAEISDAVRTVFARANEQEPERLLSALVAVRRILLQNTPYKEIPYVLDYEMVELCKFVNQFRRAMNDLPLDEETRLGVVIYCHIMEADFPYAVCRNLVSVILGQPCHWVFYAVNEDGQIKVNKKGEKIVCRYAGEKIKEMKRMAETAGMAIGKVLERLWSGAIRNAFSHSQYVIEDTGGFTLSKRLDVTASNDQRAATEPIYFTPEEIKYMSEGAQALLRAFIDAHKAYTRPYRNASPQKTDCGLIRWDMRHQQWVWSEASPWRAVIYHLAHY
jgi:hypothetical protein